MAESFEIRFIWTGQINKTYRGTTCQSRKDRYRQVVSATISLLVLIAGVNLVAILLYPENFYVSRKVASIGAVIGLASGIFLSRLNEYSTIRKHDRACEKQGEFNIKLGPEGVHIESELTDTKYDWRAISDVVDLGPGLGLAVLEWGFIPVPADSLIGLTKDEALSRITTWRNV